MASESGPPQAPQSADDGDGRFVADGQKSAVRAWLDFLLTSVVIGAAVGGAGLTIALSDAEHTPEDLQLPLYYLGVALVLFAVVTSVGVLAVLSVKAVLSHHRVDKWKRDHDEDLQFLRQRIVGTTPRQKVVRLVGVAAVVIGLVAFWTVPDLIPADPCPPPVELVVATTPEGQDALQRVGDGFADDQAHGAEDGCRPVNVLAYAPSESHRLREALVDPTGWDTSVGPIPHVWVPDSTVETELVTQELSLLERPSVRLRGGELTRRSPLIVALPRVAAATLDLDESDEGDHLELSNPWAELRAAVESGELRLARADPTTSHAATLHTAFFYHRNGAINQQGQVLDPDAAREVENTLWPGISARSDSELLCQVAEHATADVPVAALTTESALYQAQTGNAAALGCPDIDLDDLVGVYSAEFTLLDAPFVRVEPVGVNDGADDLATAFRRYLADRYRNPDTFRAPADGGVYAGYRDEQGQGAAVSELTWVPERLPTLATGDWDETTASVPDLYARLQDPGTVLLALDTSSSMRMPGRKFDTALTEALSLVSALGGDDRGGLWSFPATTDPSDTGHVAHVDVATDTQREIGERLAEQRAIHESTPLVEVIADGVAHLDAEYGGDAPMLVVVTEGVGAPERGGGDPEELTELLVDTDVRVRILAVGDESSRWGDPDPCQVDRLPDLVDIDTIECVPADLDWEGRAGHQLAIEARDG